MISFSKSFALLRAALLCGLTIAAADAAGVPADCTQLIVGIAPGWNSQSVTLRLYERAPGAAWSQTGHAWPGLLGKNGLAWGRGLAGQQEPGLHKKERDGRAPAGVFRIGALLTYDEVLPAGVQYPVTHLTDADAWVDDPENPNYNQHVTVDPANPPLWFQKSKMRRGDFAYRWLIEIRHNSDPPVSGDGSAIFFHIRRGEKTPTAGCTSMAEERLIALLRWLRPNRDACYALLPAEEYRKKWQTWDLPTPP